MNILVNSLIHLLVGGSLLVALSGHHKHSFRRFLLLIFMGAIIAITPDITKCFGDITLHSLIAAPLIGIMFAFILRVLFDYIGWKRAIFACTFIVIFGHLMIDFLGNGVALFYPFTSYENQFDIISSSELLINTILTLGIFVAAFIERRTVPVIVSMMLVSLITVALASSSLWIRNQVTEKYRQHNPQSIKIYASHEPFHWQYFVRIKDMKIVSGEAEFFSLNEEQR